MQRMRFSFCLLFVCRRSVHGVFSGGGGPVAFAYDPPGAERASVRAVPLLPGVDKSASASAATVAATSQRSGDRFLKAGDLRAAAREYDRAVRSAPNDPLLRLSAGVALAAVRDVDAAAAHFRQAWSLSEDDVIAALLLQGALSEQGKTAEAQRLLHDTVRRFAARPPRAWMLPGSIRRLTQAARRFPDSLSSICCWVMPTRSGSSGNRRAALPQSRQPRAGMDEAARQSWSAPADTGTRP